MKTRKAKLLQMSPRASKIDMFILYMCSHPISWICRYIDALLYLISIYMLPSYMDRWHTNPLYLPSKKSSCLFFFLMEETEKRDWPSFTLRSLTLDKSCQRPSLPVLCYNTVWILCCKKHVVVFLDVIILCRSHFILPCSIDRYIRDTRVTS